MNFLLAALTIAHIHTVSLTFDDGPDPVYTKQVLQILKEENVKANFFLVGQRVQEHPEIVEQILREGHDIGGHSMYHNELTKLTQEEAERDIRQCMDLVNQYQKTDRFRFPYGSFNFSLLNAVRNMGFRNFYWDVDTTDWKYPDKYVIFDKFKRRLPIANDGAIILMHDIHPQSVEALRLIIAYLKENHIKMEKLP